MRKNQWIVLGGIFFLISGYFLFWQYIAGAATPSILSVKTVQDAAAWIVSRIYSIAFLIAFGFGVACWINAWLEGRAEEKEEWEKKKEEFRQFRDKMEEEKEKRFVVKVVEKLKLKHFPQDIPELEYWGKKEGKEKEVDEAVGEWYERVHLRLVMLKEKLGRNYQKKMKNG